MPTFACEQTAQSFPGYNLRGRFWKGDGLDIGTKHEADCDRTQFVEMTHVNLWSDATAVKVPPYSRRTSREWDKVCYRAQEGR
jgi:hypothetical protein